MSTNMQYEHLENGIHSVTWLEDINRQSVDAYIELFSRLMNECPTNSTLGVLHNYENDRTPSFNALANGMKKMVMRDDVIVRIAHIYSDSSYPMIVKNATMIARFDANRRFFQAGENQEASEWLLSDDDLE